MNLGDKLSEGKIFSIENTTESGTNIVTERPVMLPGDDHDVQTNKKYFSEVLFEAFKLRSPLKYCLISLIHHSKRTEQTITADDYKNTAIFFQNDPYISWIVTYDSNDPELIRDNIICLILRIKPNDNNDLAELLLSYFKHEVKQDFTDIKIPIEFIQSLVFEK